MRLSLLLLPLLAACGETECLVADSEPTTPECDGEDGCCSFTWGSCEDGVSYELRCDSRDLPTTCTCYEDGTLTTSFEPNGYTCPPNFEEPRVATILAAANDGCGWNLTP